MANVWLSLGVVAPLFLAMALGYGLRRLRFFDDHTLKQMNNVVFRVFLPLMLFSNITHTDVADVWNPRLLLFVAVTLTVVFLLLCGTIPWIEKDNAKRGVMIQGMFRSNFVLFGLPVTTALVGEDRAGVPSLMIAVAIPLYNVLSVLVLEVCRGGRMDMKKISKGVLTNPLILSCALALLVMASGVRLPAVLDKTVTDLSRVATPLALVILGGTFTFRSLKGYGKPLTIGLLGRLVLIPGVCLPIAIACGFRGVELVSLMALYASPAAVSSFVMAEQMGGDSRLAGQYVVIGSLLSVATIFLWTLFLVQGGFVTV